MLIQTARFEFPTFAAMLRRHNLILFETKSAIAFMQLRGNKGKHKAILRELFV